MPDELVPVGSLTTMLAVKNANVTDEIDRAGVSFGNIILATGKAVAETQKKLNETGATTATALATTLVDVIAVQEKVYDDEGNISPGATHVQNLPLVNFIDPVFYQWSMLRVQGQFYAGEFATSSSSTSVNATFDHSVGINFWGVKGGFNGQLNASQVNTNSDSDYSYGNVRMNALLEPRADIGVPKPTQIIKGPHLALILGAKTTEHENQDPTKRIVARTLEVLIEYRKLDGSPIQGKSISIDAPGLLWEFTAASQQNGSMTDANGKLWIMLKREFLDEEEDTAEKQFVVSARIGIIRNATTVSC